MANTTLFRTAYPDDSTGDLRDVAAFFAHDRPDEVRLVVRMTYGNQHGSAYLVDTAPTSFALSHIRYWWDDSADTARVDGTDALVPPWLMYALATLGLKFDPNADLRDGRLVGPSRYAETRERTTLEHLSDVAARHAAPRTE